MTPATALDWTMMMEKPQVKIVSPREGNPQGAAAHPARHVVGGPSTEGAIGVTDLEHLGQGRLEESGGHADQGDHPHPEDGSGTSHEQRGGNAEDVADSHTGANEMAKAWKEEMPP